MTVTELRRFTIGGSDAAAACGVETARRLGYADAMAGRSDFKRRQWATDDPRRRAYMAGRLAATADKLLRRAPDG